MKNYRGLAMLVATTALTGIAAPAFAQSAPAEGNLPDDTQAFRLDEVIVTANKREERLQDVPISVTLISGAQIEKQNINEITDLTRSAPALNSAGPFGALSIRGVGSISFARSAEGSVGVVVDGVALANTSTNPPQLFDIARVEVLEGPQGTLFGRNSSAGVVNVTSVAPNPDAFEAIGHVDIATHDNYIARGVVNIPVAGNAALRVAGSFSQAPENQYNRFDDSYYRNRGKSVRGRFLWDPTDDITINLIGDYSKFDREGGAPWTVYTSTPGSLLTQRLEACGVTIEQENREACIDGGYSRSDESYGFSGQVDMRFSDYTLTSISAYRAYNSIYGGSDVDSVPINRLNVNESPVEIRNFSQELRLTSPVGGLIDHVVGLYYFDSQLDGFNTQRGIILGDLGLPYPVGQVQTTHASTNSIAMFGNATINVSDEFRLLAGARYGREDVDAQTTGVLAPGAVAPILAIAPINGDISDTYFSYRLGAQYDLTDNVMAYGTYTRGYKGPSVNDQTGGGAIPVLVKPEIPHAAEIGIKANLFSNRLTGSLAFFHNRVDNFQAQFFLPSASAFVFGNAPELKTEGVSLSLLGRPVRGLTLNAGVLYNDAKYGDGYLVACAQGQTAAQGCLNPSPGVFVDDAGGNRLVGSPRWKVTTFSEYAAPIGGMEAYVQADMVYSSKINFEAAFSPLAANKAAAIFGSRVGIRTEDQRFGVSVFARNIFDTYRASVRFATPVARQQLDPMSFSQISGPESRRLIGVSLDAKF